MFSFFFFFSSRRRHTRCSRDWSSDVCSSDLLLEASAKLGDDVRFLDEDDLFTLELHLSTAVLPVNHAIPDLQLHRDQRFLLPASGTHRDHLALDRLFLGRVGDVETALHRLRLLHRPNGYPIRKREDLELRLRCRCGCHGARVLHLGNRNGSEDEAQDRSEEHTSELQSRLHLVCRLLLEKKKTTVYI